MLDLLPDDHPLLATKLPLFDFAKHDAQAVATLLIEAMRHYKGAGLAANQIGLEHRAFAMETQNGPMVLFNPLISWLSQETAMMTEGCLSFPQLELQLKRPKECQISWSDFSGERRVGNFKGLECRICLHEIDHLDGILFINRASKLKLRMARKRQNKRKIRLTDD